MPSNARMGTMKAVLFTIVDVKHCCPPRAIVGEKADHLYQRCDTHAVVGRSRSCGDRIEVGREEYTIICS